MPATAGRVRMPANNRVHSSAALQTHSIWQTAILYDPYAPNREENDKSKKKKNTRDVPTAEEAKVYDSLKSLAALARSGTGANETPGACPKCGYVGHLGFQCRNMSSFKAVSEDVVLSGLEKLKGERDVKDASDEEDSESSDSDCDPEMKRAIKKYVSKRASRKLRGNESRRKGKHSSDSDDDSDQVRARPKSVKCGEKRKRGTSKKGSVRRRKRRDGSSSDDEERKRMSKKSTKKKKKHRSSRRHSDTDSESDFSSSDDSRVARYKKRHPKKKNRKHRHQDD